MYFYGPPYMAEQKQDDQLEHTYSSYVRIRDVALKTCQKRWMLGRSSEIGSGISMLAARHDDYIYIFIYAMKMHAKRHYYHCEKNGIADQSSNLGLIWLCFNRCLQERYESFSSLSKGSIVAMVVQEVPNSNRYIPM